jgi:hypothetical protein
MALITRLHSSLSRNWKCSPRLEEEGEKPVEAGGAFSLFLLPSPTINLVRFGMKTKTKILVAHKASSFSFHALLSVGHDVKEEKNFHELRFAYLG